MGSTYVAHNETMLELATSAGLRLRLVLIVCVNLKYVLEFSLSVLVVGEVRCLQEVEMYTRPRRPP